MIANINKLTDSLSNLTDTLVINSNTVTQQSLAFRQEIETALKYQQEAQEVATLTLRQEVQDTIMFWLDE